jgi:phosphatidylserine decarboxylase
MKKVLMGASCVVVFLLAFVLFFSRAPVRTIPQNGIISPTSGRVIGIEQEQTPNLFFTKKGTQNTISIPEMTGPVSLVIIELTPLDVHVQRAPISGQIIRMDHYDGNHTNALGAQKLILSSTNEKVVTLFKNTTDTIGVVQVAGMAARRIVNHSHVDDMASKGFLYGRILLGSQVVVIIPSNHTVNVHVGDRVVDGETILAN